VLEVWVSGGRVLVVSEGRAWAAPVVSALVASAWVASA
jgi:hypothetical protein